MIFVAEGSLLASELLCFWVSLSSLLQIDLDESLVPAPAEPQEEEEEKPRLTKLGRPIEEKRLK